MRFRKFLLQNNSSSLFSLLFNTKNWPNNLNFPSLQFPQVHSYTLTHILYTNLPKTYRIYLKSPLREHIYQLEYFI